MEDIDLFKKTCYDCMYFETETGHSCRIHKKHVLASNETCEEFKEKIFTKFTIDNWETVIRNEESGEEYGVNGVVYKLNELYYLNQELYEFRLIYNAHLFNEWAKTRKYEVYKSRRHHDGKLCFDGEWFVVVAILPTGQITNHYHIKDWELFKIPTYGKVKDEFDGHTSRDVLERLKRVIK